MVIGYNQIRGESGKRRMVVAANVRDRDLGSFVTGVQAAVGQGVEIPPGYWLEYGALTAICSRRPSGLPLWCP